MARPSKDPNERRSAVVPLRLTEAEHNYVREQASAAGISVSEYLRRRSLSLPVQPTPSRVDASLISEINRIGNNVNQLARATHTDRDFVKHWRAIGDELTTVLEKVVLAYGS